MKLTKREWEVLRLLAWCNKDIALLLGLHLQTVKNYVWSIGKKLQCGGPTGRHTRVKVLLAALRGGHVRLEELSLGPVRF